MREKHIGRNESKGIFYGELEEYARGKIREHLQDLLEQEVSEWLGREKSERKVHPLEQPGYRNGYGKRRRFKMSVGTVEIRRPLEAPADIERGGIAFLTGATENHSFETI